MKFEFDFRAGLLPFLKVVSHLPPSNFQFDAELISDDPFEDGEDVIELDDLGAVDKTKGPLSIAGQMVVLYIKDHGSNALAVINGDVEAGRRVHLAYCSTLEKMERENKFDRYHLSRNPKRKYLISGSKYYWGDEVVEDEAELAICKNCLNFLDYDGYRQLNYRDRTSRTRAFDYDRFFSVYSSLFKKMPKKTEDDSAGYVEGWRQISIDKRSKANFTCQDCGFKAAPQDSAFIHVHHVNSDKTDNSDANLRVLCIDCHKLQPGHGHMWIEPKLLERFRKAKREAQGRLTREDSNTFCMDYIDPALRSPANRLFKLLRKTPEVAYEHEENGRIVFQADVAFVSLRIGICLELTDSEKRVAEQFRWTLMTHNEAMDFRASR
jgi:hypothetical protein